MSDLIIADQEFSQSSTSLAKALLEVRCVCMDYATILRVLSEYDGFKTKAFQKNISSYVPNIESIAARCEDLAEGVYEETGSYIGDIDDADDFIY